ncbi:MAG TPA: D-glycero-beta-D-manno-heptose 1,7-bisphosphate 7-phosphatase [Gammaproteobacteria bacterium]|nr:D-glycero-beta-D-manno-heptose 1,7-bisphosphate 7-phosphatase [Gammaproteobacteria bacterium]
MSLIVLDRDGVVNEEVEDYLASAEAWVPIPGSLEAMVRLAQTGHRLVIASDQPAIGRGLITPDVLFAIHRRMQRELAALGGSVDGLFFCPHLPEDDCHCRKPRPGLLEDIGRRFQTELEEVLVVGDQLGDLEAAISAGARPVLVRTGRGEATLAALDERPDVPVYRDLNELSLALAEAGRAAESRP